MTDKKRAADYARDALKSANGDVDVAVTRIVGWCQSDSDARAAFGNIDRMDAVRLAKHAREAVNKVLRQQGLR